MSSAANDRSLVIYRLVKRQVDLSIRDEIEAKAKLAAAVEGARLWTADEDNVFGRCPYNVELMNNRAEASEKARLEWQAILDHTVEMFLIHQVLKDREQATSHEPLP